MFGVFLYVFACICFILNYLTKIMVNNSTEASKKLHLFPFLCFFGGLILVVLFDFFKGKFSSYSRAGNVNSGIF